MAAQKIGARDGYWVPEDEWKRLGDVVLALNGLSSLLREVQGRTSLTPASLSAMIDLYASHLMRVHGAGYSVDRGCLVGAGSRTSAPVSADSFFIHEAHYEQVLSSASFLSGLADIASPDGARPRRVEFIGAGGGALFELGLNGVREAVQHIVPVAEVVPPTSRMVGGFAITGSQYDQLLRVSDGAGKIVGVAEQESPDARVSVDVEDLASMMRTLSDQIMGAVAGAPFMVIKG